jgi:hypothetical protein
MKTHDSLRRHRARLIAAAVMTVVATVCMPALAQKASANLPGPGTETMHSVAHVKRGMEGRYAELSAQAWALYRKLDLVLEKPHVVLRGVDAAGLPYFVEVFTWRSADIPDHAPPEVLAIWKQLEESCEKRDGRPGIDFSEVTAVAVD